MSKKDQPSPSYGEDENGPGPILNDHGFERAVGKPLASFAHKCHAASIALVKSGVLPPARVARGTCIGVGSQHSWVVLGNDCYAENATIIDPTLWSYRADVNGIWVGDYADGWHTPHGKGNIWQWGRPQAGDGEPIELVGDLSRKARQFLDILGPLDRQGWGMLAHAPVGGWPASEIIAAIDRTPRLRALVPVDIVGMLTDLNPGGLYLSTTMIGE